MENCISIFLQEEDGEVLEKIKECFESEIPIKFVPYNDGRRKNQKKFSLTNEHLARTLEGLGVTHNKTFILKYPDFLTEELTPHFIRGYFDGDGCVWFSGNKNRKVYQHCFGITGTLDICEHISKILEEKCDAKLHIRKRFKDKDESYTIRQAECGGNLKVKRIFNYLYKDATIYMNRKYQRFIRNTP